MNENLKSRLLNFKFSSAANYLNGEIEDTQNLVNILSRLFSNSGCFNGDMGDLICFALKGIGIDENG